MNVSEFLQVLMAGLHYAVAVMIVGGGLIGILIFLYQLSRDIRRRSGRSVSLASVANGSSPYGSVLDE